MGHSRPVLDGARGVIVSQVVLAGQRQTDPELAALADAVALGRDGSTVKTDDALDDREPESESTLCGAACALEKRVEDVWQGLLGDADPRIPDPDQHLSAVQCGRELDQTVRLA